MIVTQQGNWYFELEQASDWNFDITQQNDWSFVLVPYYGIGSFDPDSYSAAFFRSRP